MKKLLILLFVAFFLNAEIAANAFMLIAGRPCGGENDFSNDDNCVAHWKFENGALTTDSKGGNTLTDHGTVSTSTTDYKEGSASADFNATSSEYFSITDTDLDPNFPFRAGDGSPGDDISLCFWIKPDVLGDNDYIFSKYDTIADKRTFAVLIYSDEITISVGYSNGDTGQSHQFGTNMSIGKWYHVGITFQNASANASSIRTRIWDNDAGALLATDYTTSSAKTINIENADLCIADREGAANRLYDGHIDEMVVFKDILSAAEIDKIRGGTYP